MYYKTKTPGSLMIMGEHSVLYGHPSIVASVNKYLHVAIRKGKPGRVRIDSDYFGSYEADTASFFYHPSSHSLPSSRRRPGPSPTKILPQRKLGSSTKIIKEDHFVGSLVGLGPGLRRDDGIGGCEDGVGGNFDIILAIVARYAEFLGDGIDIQVKSDFSPELGLGSSGALIVGFVSALMMMFKRKVSKEELLLETVGILQSIRKFASGSDLAASIYEGVVYFDPNTCRAERIADSLPIIAAYSGYKTKTDDVIAKINKEFQGRESELESIYSENGRLTRAAALTILNKDYMALGKLMNKANIFVYGLLNLVTPELRTILEKFRWKDFVYGTKVSGAGLGDCAIALVKDKDCHSQFTDLQLVPLYTSKLDIIHMILGDKLNDGPMKQSGTAFASSNIAICKYWGKRDEELHLPMNSSLSISLDDFGSKTTISLSTTDEVRLNGKLLRSDTSFVYKLFQFIDLFRQGRSLRFFIEIESNIPIAAGLASSAAGFAAITLALNDLFGWGLSIKNLSMLARLGSGSAARSIEKGFVQWHKGSRDDGMDSYAVKLPITWPSLQIGILTVSEQAKLVSSRVAMKISKETSPIFRSWVQSAERDVDLLIAAIKARDFIQFGMIAERNSDLMHETMATSSPSIVYGNTETKKLIAKIKSCRETTGLPIFYTQDAGPNLVIFFEKKDEKKVKSLFAMNLSLYSSSISEIYA